MTDTSSLGSSEDALPVYFRPFTRESLKAIYNRMAEDEIKKKEIEARKAEQEVKVCFLSGVFLSEHLRHSGCVINLGLFNRHS